MDMSIQSFLNHIPLFFVDDATATCPEGTKEAYFYDASSGKCGSLCVMEDSTAEASASAANPHSLNNFNDLFVCQWACEDPCMQPVDGGNCEELKRQGGTPPQAVERFYYDASTRSYKTFTYSGCEGNKNSFETAAECASVCPVDVRVSVNGSTVSVSSLDLNAQLTSEDGRTVLTIDALFPSANGEDNLELTETLALTNR